jgi:hypothetical protein
MESSLDAWMSELPLQDSMKVLQLQRREMEKISLTARLREKRAGFYTDV